MAARGPASVLQLFRAVAVREPRETADGLLLRRYVEAADQDAFAALVARHGPMVLGVCRRVLANAHDAEDAFQATFLVLARKAASVSRAELLGNWLYGVAYRTALRARARSSRRRETGGVPELAAAESSRDLADVRPVLDAEIAGLTDKYRRPFVLCYLEGKTNEEAAQLLACPVGTVFTRLAGARQRLRTRLVRRGIAPAAALTATLLSADGLAAEVPASLAASTLAASMQFAYGLAAASVPRSVPSLAEGVLRAMFIRRIRSALVVAMILGFSAAGAGLCTYRSQAAQDEGNAVNAGEPPEDGKLADLLKKRQEVAQEAFAYRMKRYHAGGVPPDVVLPSATALLHAETELAVGHEALVAANAAHVARMREIFQISEAMLKAGRIGNADHLPTEYHLLDAEIRLERAKRAKR